MMKLIFRALKKGEEKEESEREFFGSTYLFISFFTTEVKTVRK